jgi:adenylate cyclase class 2
MNQSGREIEVKFYLSKPQAFAARLAAAGAELIQERLFELNLRFDRPDGSLSRAQQVLRLRQDNRARLTFKGPAAAGEAVSDRLEIEFEVSDFSAARRLLEALGYQVTVLYEKWRTTYRLGELEIVYDELPYGHFCEIEGPDEASIRRAASRLGLDWQARILPSYLALFERLKAHRRLPARDLSFAALAGLTVLPEDLGVLPADNEPE